VVQFQKPKFSFVMFRFLFAISVFFLLGSKSWFIFENASGNTGRPAYQKFLSRLTRCAVFPERPACANRRQNYSDAILEIRIRNFTAQENLRMYFMRRFSHVCVQTLLKPVFERTRATTPKNWKSHAFWILKKKVKNVEKQQIRNWPICIDHHESAHQND